jgi:hypothetical protein
VVLVSEVADRPVSDEARALRSLIKNRARAELMAADSVAPGSDTVRWRGSLLPAVAVVKGSPGPAESSGDPAFSGADGEAAAKALVALGYEESQLFYTISRPQAGVDPELRARRLRLQIEAVDAPVVIATDVSAAEDVARAFGLDAVTFGEEVVTSGRRLVAVDGLEDSLSSKERKRIIWAQFAAAKPPRGLY